MVELGPIGKLNYAISQVVAAAAEIAVTAELGKEVSDDFWLNHVNGQGVRLGKDGYPEQWFELDTDGEIAKFEALEGFVFHFAFDNVVWRGRIRLGKTRLAVGY